MLKIKTKKQKPPQYKVKVVDEDGTIEIFSGVPELAKLMNVTRQAIYFAIAKEITVCGCRVYKVEKEAEND